VQKDEELAQLKKTMEKNVEGKVSTLLSGFAEAVKERALSPNCKNKFKFMNRFL
jgi:hypothetical protein